MTKRPFAYFGTGGKDNTLQGRVHIMYSPTLDSTSANPLPRFAGDWIAGWINPDTDTGLLHVGAGPHEWVLEALTPQKLNSALAGRGPVEVQFNPELLVVLVPGAHELVGSSFFRLRS